jgi:hypothetical protein
VCVDFLFDRSKFFTRPELVRIAGEAPSGIIAARLVAGLIAAGRTKIIDQVNDEVSASALPGKTIMFTIQLVSIKSESKFHE